MIKNTKHLIPIYSSSWSSLLEKSFNWSASSGIIDFSKYNLENMIDNQLKKIREELFELTVSLHRLCNNSVYSSIRENLDSNKKSELDILDSIGDILLASNTLAAILSVSILHVFGGKTKIDSLVNMPIKNMSKKIESEIEIDNNEEVLLSDTINYRVIKAIKNEIDYTNVSASHSLYFKALINSYEKDKDVLNHTVYVYLSNGLIDTINRYRNNYKELNFNNYKSLICNMYSSINILYAVIRKIFKYKTKENLLIEVVNYSYNQIKNRKYKDSFTRG